MEQTRKWTKVKKSVLQWVFLINTLIVILDSETMTAYFLKGVHLNQLMTNCDKNIR